MLLLRMIHLLPYSFIIAGLTVNAQQVIEIQPSILSISGTCPDGSLSSGKCDESQDCVTFGYTCVEKQCCQTCKQAAKSSSGQTYQCDISGDKWQPKQCSSTQCWCVSMHGQEIVGTRVSTENAAELNCHSARRQFITSSNQELCPNGGAPLPDPSTRGRICSPILRSLTCPTSYDCVYSPSSKDYICCSYGTSGYNPNQNLISSSNYGSSANYGSSSNNFGSSNNNYGSSSNLYGSSGSGSGSRTNFVSSNYGGLPSVSNNLNGLSSMSSGSMLNVCPYMAMPSTQNGQPRRCTPQMFGNMVNSPFSNTQTFGSIVSPFSSSISSSSSSCPGGYSCTFSDMLNQYICCSNTFQGSMMNMGQPMGGGSTNSGFSGNLVSPMTSSNMNSQRNQCPIGARVLVTGSEVRGCTPNYSGCPTSNGYNCLYSANYGKYVCCGDGSQTVGTLTGGSGFGVSGNGLNVYPPTFTSSGGYIPPQQPGINQGGYVPSYPGGSQFGTSYPQNAGFAGGGSGSSGFPCPVGMRPTLPSNGVSCSPNNPVTCPQGSLCMYGSSYGRFSCCTGAQAQAKEQQMAIYQEENVE